MKPSVLPQDLMTIGYRIIHWNVKFWITNDHWYLKNYIYFTEFRSSRVNIYFLPHVSNYWGVSRPARVKRPGLFIYFQSSLEGILTNDEEWGSYDARCCKILQNPCLGKSFLYLICKYGCCRNHHGSSIIIMSHRSPCLQLSTPELILKLYQADSVHWNKLWWLICLNPRDPWNKFVH